MENNIEENNKENVSAEGEIHSNDEINILDYIIVVLKYRKMIIITSLVTFLLACLITLLMPNIYASTARILVPQEIKGRLESFMGEMSGLAALAGVPLSGSAGELYVGMLQSRTIADNLIKQFDLMNVYNQKYLSDVYLTLGKHADITLGKKDGIIAIRVKDKDPKRAADMANAYVGALKQLTIELNLSSSGREKKFLESRLEVIKGELTKTEEKLREFQEKNKTIRIDDQTTVLIEAIAKIKGELASKEVELGAILTYQTEQNAEVKIIREDIKQLEAQLQKLTKSPANEMVNNDIFFKTSEVPVLEIQYARLIRDFKVKETLFELLNKQYEISKINEAKNTSTLQVLDEAKIPDKKIEPRRSIIVMVSTIIAGVISVILSFIKESIKGIKEEDQFKLLIIKKIIIGK